MSRRVIVWAFSALAVLAAVIIVSAIWDGMWSWLPWSDESRLERTEQQRDTAVLDASARGLEVEGLTEQQTRLDATHRVIVDVTAATSETISQARSAPDATDPLDPARLSRLRDHDRELCRLSPNLAGCSSPTSASDAGD